METSARCVLSGNQIAGELRLASGAVVDAFKAKIIGQAARDSREREPRRQEAYAGVHVGEARAVRA